MKRYAAFLRGVSPMNAKMPALKAALEDAGFAEVKTVLTSGNIVFSADPASEAALERAVAAAIDRRLGYTFLTIVRPLAALRRLLARDPFASFRLRPGAKRVVTFLRRPLKATLAFPIDVDGARILGKQGREIFTAYVPGPRAAAFMRLIEKTCGKDVTTRTWDTVVKVAK
jgi:uncharacterized protein (DUF1697 family)